MGSWTGSRWRGRSGGRRGRAGGSWSGISGGCLGCCRGWSGGAGGGGAGVDDLAQETFLRVFRALPGFTAMGSARLSTWILTIATRLGLDEIRRRPAVTAPIEEAAAAADEDAVQRRAIGRAIEN